MFDGRLLMAERILAGESKSIMLREVADFKFVLNGVGVVNACAPVNIRNTVVMVASLNILMLF